METNEIDLSALEAEVENISEEDLLKRLVQLRTNQLKSAARNRQSPKAVEARRKQMEKQKLLIKKAKESGLWERINAMAKEAAAKEAA